MNSSISIGVLKAEWRDGETQSTPIGTPRVSAISGDLGCRQHAAVAGLGALRQLQLDHLDLRRGGVGGEALFREAAVVVAAAEVAGADFPDQVAAVLAVVRADAAFAGVVHEAARLAPPLSAGWRWPTARQSSSPRC
jgi:hypothetical protein